MQRVIELLIYLLIALVIIWGIIFVVGHMVR